MIKYFQLSKNEEKFLKLLKCKKGLNKNYYRFSKTPQGRYSRCLMNYIFPERHFVKKGIYSNRAPFEGYSPSNYDDYLFLAEDKKEIAYQCYLNNKSIPKEKICKKSGCVYEELNQIELEYKAINFEVKNNKKSIAVVFHVYYFDLLDELLSYLSRIPIDFDLYITLNNKCSELNKEKIYKKINKVKPDAFIYYVPNHGRDIYPFISLINNSMLDGYEAILKIHSKKKAHLPKKGKKNRHNLIESIIPPNIDLKLLEHFKKKSSLGIIVSSGFVSGSEDWSLSKYKTYHFLNKLNLKMNEKHLKFPAGSIYWIKNNITDELKKLNLSCYDFPLEKGLNDNETPHVIERLIGAIAVSKELKILPIKLKTDH